MPSRACPPIAVFAGVVAMLLACATPIPILDASGEGDLRRVDHLLSQGVHPDTARSDGETGLHRAAEGGHLAVAERLIESGASVDARTRAAVTPLMRAAKRGRVALVSLLIRRGADPAAADGRRRTALHHAARDRHSEVARVLVKAGAPLDARNDDRETPLFTATDKGDREVTALLLESGADPSLPDRDGKTPLLVATEQGDLALVRMLLEAGAKPDHGRRDRVGALWTAVRKHDAETAEVLLEHGADPNALDAGGTPMLLSAVRSRDAEMVELLLEARADPDATDASRQTPLVVAVLSRDVEIAELLLENKANPNATDASGMTPLVIAMNAKDAELTEALLEHGADPELYSRELEDPVGFASRYGYGALAKAMIGKGLEEARRAMQPELPQPDEHGSPAPPPPRAADEDFEPFYSKRIAVVIGIDQYRHYPPLEGATRDARSVAESFRQLGFDEVIELYDADATRTGLLRVLGSDLPRKTDRESFAVIYFAGHGETETLPQGQKRGYIVPVDADPDHSFATAISMDSLRDLSNRLPAKQIYYAMDSCYSGLGLVRGIRAMPSESPGYVEKITSMRAVQMITAGSEGEQAEEIGGQGLFTSYFLRALSGEADFDDNGFVTASEIGTFVRPQVTRASRSRQTPQFGTLDGAGEVVFPVR
jgi:ankyrin repeat protein